MTVPPTGDASPPAPTRASTVSLREINKENWRAVTQLVTLPSQAANVSTNAMSLVESHYSEDAWARAIYADDTPVGFLMMSIWDPDEWYCVWRFMIDHRYQKMGFGREAILLAIKHVRENHPQAKLMRLMSASPDGKKGTKPEDSPYKFYAKLGFKDIAEIDERGEIEMGMDL
ncbi:GCN5-related N-acetyltransferase [Purpureocillium lavendulum]|uniref:GCN5-related N-acetyltransferase n=1 Tax=Purpureocillium lavendulum TaxID=1247861 RepID=A0AB34FVV9_9HYPO|nr:GCN5-related N-acetyltransferase [Purpureocillium lavendulum]